MNCKNIAVAISLLANVLSLAGERLQPLACPVVKSPMSFPGYESQVLMLYDGGDCLIKRDVLEHWQALAEETEDHMFNEFNNIGRRLLFDVIRTPSGGWLIEGHKNIDESHERWRQSFMSNPHPERVGGYQNDRTHHRFLEIHMATVVDGKNIPENGAPLIISTSLPATTEDNPRILRINECIDLPRVDGPQVIPFKMQYPAGKSIVAGIFAVETGTIHGTCQTKTGPMPFTINVPPTAASETTTSRVTLHVGEAHVLSDDFWTRAADAPGIAKIKSLPAIVGLSVGETLFQNRRTGEKLLVNVIPFLT